MYQRPYQRQNKPPSGCLESLIISRIIIGIVLVPTLVLIGALLALLLTFYALSISPFLALAVLLVCGAILGAVAYRERQQVNREMHRYDDEDD